MSYRVVRLAAVIAGLAVVAEAGGPTQSQTVSRTQPQTVSRHTLRFAGSGERTLRISTINGSIHVTRHSAADVRVEARRTATARTEAALRQSEENVTLQLVDDRPDIEVVARDIGGPACGERWQHAWRDQPRYSVRLDFDVQVPDGTRLILCTVNGGEIEVRGTRGDFAITNVNGGITLTDVGGSGSAETVNGPVEARLASVPGVASRFKTVNGDVTVTWPARLAADLRLKTFNGGLFTDFDVQPIPSPARPAVRGADGRFMFETGGHTVVRVGGGGPEVTLESFNGDVRVLRASR